MANHGQRKNVPIDTLKEQEVVYQLDELERIMNAELSKEPDKIDTDYVDELAQLILDCRSDLVRTSTNHAVRRRARRRFIKAAIMVIICGTAALGWSEMADAWSWIRIVEFFTPMMEQLGIQVNLLPDESVNEVRKPANDERHIISSEWSEIVDEVITDKEDLPATIDGYPVLTPVMPEEFEFVRAELFAMAPVTTVCMTYSSGEQEVYVQIQLNTQGIGNAIWLSEQSEKAYQRNRVIVYEDNGIWTAYMAIDIGSYQIWGNADRDTIETIANSYKGVVDQ